MQSTLKERIVLFGYYDVDGVPSIAMLYSMLSCGHTAPNRPIPSPRVDRSLRIVRRSGNSLSAYFSDFQPELFIALDLRPLPPLTIYPIARSVVSG